MPSDRPNSTEDIFASLGIQPIINGVGYATRVTGSCPHPDVIAAMSAASGAFFELDDLLSAASELIAKITGAQAGIVTCGAGAALSLAAAACLAGNDPDAMDRLPDTSRCVRDEIIFPQPGPFDYDHAIRVSGAKLTLIDYRVPDALHLIERAIGPRTAAIGYAWLEVQERPSISELAELAHRHRLPLIVDAACALPPTDNIGKFSSDGADLIAYSGGKHLGGPQASGILCGRADLIRSAWVQMVDMDVRAGTWSLQYWVDQGWIARAPRHGIGRSMKVSKEAIIGVMAALHRYQTRDHQAEHRAWNDAIDEIYAGVKDITQINITRHSQGANGQPYPNLRIESGPGLSVRALLLALRHRPKRIVLAEDERSPDRAVLYPFCLQPGDAAEIVVAIRQVVIDNGKGRA